MQFIILFGVSLFILIPRQYRTDEPLSYSVDTLRFELHFNSATFWLIDNQHQDSVKIETGFLLDHDSVIQDEKSYVTSNNFSSKTTAFDIDNDLMGIHLVSYEFMKEGSAQAGAGRDMFLIYDPENKKVSDKLLDFGITKQRYRYMGCLFAKTYHFILADTDQNNKMDIGCIAEELKCDEFSNTFFYQHTVKWYGFLDNSWTQLQENNLPDTYIDLPLINLKINPIDVFGFNKWQSFDPEKWQGESQNIFYPQYRLELMENQKPR